MMEQNMEQMKVSKEERKACIRRIVSGHKVFNQKQIVSLLKKEYKIEVDQSAVSRYLQEMGIKKDPKTKAFVLGERVVRNQEANLLRKVLKDADVEMMDSEMKCFVLKGKKEYLPLVAERMEQFFSLDDISISIFIGYNGSMLVYYHEQDAQKVERYLEKIFDSLSK